MSSPVFRRQFETRQTIAYGEVLTLGTMVAPQPEYTGPVDVVLGQYDYISCTGNCSYPANQAQAFVNALFPKSVSKGTYLQPEAGHLNALHYTAAQGFAHSLDFLRDSGIKP